jgi:hypothetical protein
MSNSPPIKSNKPKSAPSNEPKLAPDYKVIDSTDCGIDNYPGSVEAAKLSVEQLILNQLKDGYHFTGNLSRYVGGELRTFYIFYRVS